MSPLFKSGAGNETTLIELKVETLAKEKLLQGWLADHPELLGSSEIDPSDPPRFLLIKREVHDSSAGFLDHLFVDHNGVPTFVEAKLSANAESRRKVVGQLLDYASEGSTSWTADQVKGWLEERCEKEGLNPDSLLVALETNPPEPEAFWTRVEENLRAGRVRLVFACDEVPKSLQRIVEFLNERMSPTEVLAVEIQSFQSEDDPIFSSSLVGATPRAQVVKKKARKPDAIPTLIKEGLLSNGQELWLLRDWLADSKPDADDDPRLRMVLELSESGGPKVRYHPPGGDARTLAPSRISNEIRREIDPSFSGTGALSVGERIALEPGGDSLADICYRDGHWTKEEG